VQLILRRLELAMRRRVLVPELVDEGDRPRGEHAPINVGGDDRLVLGRNAPGRRKGYGFGRGVADVPRLNDELGEDDRFSAGVDDVPHEVGAGGHSIEPDRNP
jgi:hypothetical protein